MRVGGVNIRVGGEGSRGGVIGGVMGSGDSEMGRYGMKPYPIECRDPTAERESLSMVRWKSVGEADGRRYSSTLCRGVRGRLIGSGQS